MRALICEEWTDLAGLKVGELPDPSPSDDEVLIEVRSTAVNYADSIMVRGHYQTKPPFPFSPGLETAGADARQRAGIAANRDDLVVF